MSRDSVNRRNILKSVGVSTIAGLASVGTAVADGPDNEIRRQLEKYSDSKQIRSVLDNRARGLLRELAKRKLIARPSASTFDLETDIGSRSIDDSDTTAGRKVFATWTDEGDATPHVLLFKKTDVGTVSVHLEPERNRNYAIVRSEDSERKTLIDLSLEQVELTTDDGVSTQSECPDRNECSKPSWAGAEPCADSCICNTQYGCDYCCYYPRYYYSCWLEHPDYCQCRVEDTSCECLTVASECQNV